MDSATLKKRYPETTRLIEVNHRSQIIGEFIEYGGYELCKWDDGYSEYIPVQKTTEQILAEYFEIDLAKVERERAEIIKELMKENQ